VTECITCKMQGKTCEMCLVPCYYCKKPRGNTTTGHRECILKYEPGELRDKLAIAAWKEGWVLASVVGKIDWHEAVKQGRTSEYVDEASRAAYRIADSMLRIREEGFK